MSEPITTYDERPIETTLDDVDAKAIEAFDLVKDYLLRETKPSEGTVNIVLSSLCKAIDAYESAHGRRLELHRHLALDIMTWSATLRASEP